MINFNLRKSNNKNPGSERTRESVNADMRRNQPLTAPLVIPAIR